MLEYSKGQQHKESHVARANGNHKTRGSIRRNSSSTKIWSAHLSLNLKELSALILPAGNSLLAEWQLGRTMFMVSNFVRELKLFATATMKKDTSKAFREWIVRMGTHHTRSQFEVGAWILKWFQVKCFRYAYVIWPLWITVFVRGVRLKGFSTSSSSAVRIQKLSGSR